MKEAVRFVKVHFIPLLRCAILHGVLNLVWYSHLIFVDAMSLLELGHFV